MFEPGYRKLHIAIISFTIGFWSLFLMIGTFILILSTNEAVGTRELLTNILFITPLITWVVGILLALAIYLTIKCKSCGKLLLVVTDINHTNRNKGWMFWFLKPLPPTIICEHCGEAFGNTPNQSLNQIGANNAPPG